jgi:peroxin-19
MQEMMKQMESLADNSEFQNMLEGMMNQLMSKELLYEPMKDLAAKVS